MTKIFQPGGPKRYAHQVRGLKSLIRTGGRGALLFDPGLGKTATTIDYASVLALKSPQREARVLVVCPLAAVDTWVHQMGLWTSPEVNFWAEAVSGSLLQRADVLASRGGNPFSKPMAPKGYRKGNHRRAHQHHLAWSQASEPKVDPADGPEAVPGPRIVLEVINIDTLSQRRQVGSKTMADIMVEAIKRFQPDLMVVDESHKIKSSSSNASRLLARVTKFVPRRILLTGTVMPHSPLDVFGQWRFLDPYAFGTLRPDGSVKQATFGGFKNRYAQLGGWMGKEVVGFQRLEEMQDIMGELAVVARKEDSLDLPDTTDVTIPVHLSPGETKAYADMKRDLSTDLAKGVTATASSMLTRMMRLRQITSGHLPDDAGNVHEVGRSKVNTIRSLVHDTLAGESRVVIFALFTHEIQQLADGLAEKGTEIQVIAGGTSGEERLRLRKRFGSDDPTRMVMIAQIKTMSLAVNELVTASHAIYASMSQQRDDYVQSRDRLNRIGQTKPMTFWHAIAPGTVDDVILQSHRNRTDLENAMLQHIKGES